MKPKPWNALRRMYGNTVSILRALDVDDDVRVIVVGDPNNGSYDWGIERNGLVEQHSDCGYGMADVALRDGLIAYFGLPAPDGYFMREIAPKSEPCITPAERMAEAAKLIVENARCSFCGNKLDGSAECGLANCPHVGPTPATDRTERP